MSYDEHDAAMDEMYERIGDELYPEHRAQAIGEFTADRLSSYYLANPMVMRPAVDALQESKRLNANGHHSRQKRSDQGNIGRSCLHPVLSAQTAAQRT